MLLVSEFISLVLFELSNEWDNKLNHFRLRFLLDIFRRVILINHPVSWHFPFFLRSKNGSPIDRPFFPLFCFSSFSLFLSKHCSSFSHSFTFVFHTLLLDRVPLGPRPNAHEEGRNENPKVPSFGRKERFCR